MSVAGICMISTLSSVLSEPQRQENISGFSMKGNRHTHSKRFVNTDASEAALPGNHSAQASRYPYC